MSKPTTRRGITVCITRFAREYQTTVPNFKMWIESYPELKEVFKPFMDENGNIIERSLPPIVETTVYQVLGEP